MKQHLRSYAPWFGGLLLCLFLGFVFFPWINPYYQSIFMISGIFAILAVSLTLINGFTGQFSLGHAGFMAVGGYTSAAITFYLMPSLSGWLQSLGLGMGASEQLVFFASLLAGGCTAALSGYLVGLPSLRLKGDYLAIVTLGFGEIIRVSLLNIDSLGGARGLTGIKPYTNVHWILIPALFTTFTVLRLLGSAPGRAMLSVREDEVAAESMGVNTTGVKVKAFVLGAAWAGFAGGLYAHYYAYLNPSSFTFMKSFEVIVIIVLGGLGSVSGAILAAIFMTVLPEALRPLQQITQLDFRMIIYSLILIIFMLVRPNGLFGKHEVTHYLKRWKRGKA